MEIFIKGALISGGLIIAIGGQNAFVLQRGLIKTKIFVVCLTCFICDMLLMTLGVIGVGLIISSSRTLTVLLAGAGGMFSIWYGIRAFSSAFRSTGILDEGSKSNAVGTVAATIGSTLAITLLNPHVYLDTMVLIGGVASTLPLCDKGEFLCGALVASFVWFFSLGYGARLLRPVFKRPNTWRALEFLIGSIMWWFAYQSIEFAITVP